MIIETIHTTCTKYTPLHQPPQSVSPVSNETEKKTALARNTMDDQSRSDPRIASLKEPHQRHAKKSQHSLNSPVGNYFPEKRHIARGGSLARRTRTLPPVYRSLHADVSGVVDDAVRPPLVCRGITDATLIDRHALAFASLDVPL